jgi:hypothetical protein
VLPASPGRVRVTALDFDEVRRVLSARKISWPGPARGRSPADMQLRASRRTGGRQGRNTRGPGPAHALLDPTAPLWLTSPEAAAAESSRALVSAYAEAGRHKSPEAERTCW